MNIRSWVPRGLTIKCVNLVHHVSGHMGVVRTLELARQRYVFPGMWSLCRQLLISCETCCRVKRGPGALHQYRQLFEPTTQLFSHLHLNFMGPFCASTPATGKHSYILVITDRTSRWVCLIPLPNIQGNTVIRAFTARFIRYYGAPKAIHRQWNSIPV